MLTASSCSGSSAAVAGRRSDGLASSSRDCTATSPWPCWCSSRSTSTTTVVDGFVPIGWLDVIVPFHSAYRPIWVGLGALAVDCLLAIIVTSLLRVRIGPRCGVAVHWLAYACWPIALVHGLGTGTDAPERWMQALDAVAMFTVLVVLGWRIMARRPRIRQGRRWRSQRR